LKFEGIPIKENPPGSTWFIAPIFVIIGLGVMYLAVWIWMAREFVAESGDEIAFGVWSFGRAWRMRRMKKNDVEEVELKPMPLSDGRRTISIGGTSFQQGPTARPRHQVCVRSHTETLRTGAALSEGEQDWLKRAVAAIVSGS